MNQANSPSRKLAAIVFTDIAGFTKLSSDNEEYAFSLIEKQRELLKPIVKSYKGRWLKEMGDGLLLSFPSSKQALSCSIEIQNLVKDVDDLNLRIGIHQGDIITGNKDVFGDDVNIASRIEPFSAIGGIAISNKVNDDISGSPEFDTKFIAEPMLKGVNQAIKIFAVTSNDLPLPNLKEVKAKLEKGKPNKKSYILSILVLLVIAFTALNFFDLFEAKNSFEKMSIAVLPFDNLSSDESNQFLAEGIMQSILHELSSMSEINVISRASMMTFSARNLTIPEIANKLNVTHVLDGSLQRASNKIRITTQLYTSDDIQVWSKQYDNELDDIFGLQTQLSGKITKAIISEILDRKDTSSSRVYTRNTEAYEHYLNGLKLFEKFNFQEAIQSYSKSIDKDPEFALAYLKRAGMYRYLYFLTNQGNENFANQSRNDLARAIVLNPNLPEIVAEQGFQLYQMENKYIEAISRLKEAAIKMPNYDEIFFMLGFIYMRLGEFELGVEASKRAVDLNPLSYIHNSAYAEALRFNKEYQKAFTVLKKIESNKIGKKIIDLEFFIRLRLSEDSQASLKQVGIEFDHPRFAMYSGQFAEAILRLEQDDDLSIRTRNFYYSEELQLAMYSFLSKDKSSKLNYAEKTRDHVEKLIEKSRFDHRNYIAMSLAYALLENEEKMLEYSNLAKANLKNTIDVISNSTISYHLLLGYIFLADQEKASALKHELLNSKNVFLDESEITFNYFFRDLR